MVCGDVTKVVTAPKNQTDHLEIFTEVVYFMFEKVCKKRRRFLVVKDLDQGVNSLPPNQWRVMRELLFVFEQRAWTARTVRLDGNIEWVLGK